MFPAGLLPKLAHLLRFGAMAVSDWVVIWLQVSVAVGTIGPAAGTYSLARKAGSEVSNAGPREGIAGRPRVDLARAAGLDRMFS
jgi:hypothetical protein